MPFSEFTPIMVYNVENFYFEIFDLESFRIGYFTSRGIEKTQQLNEDTLFITPQGEALVLGVADGAGGHPKGQDAAVLIGTEMLDHQKRDMLTLIEASNQRIIDLKVGARSTLALAKIVNDMAYFYHVGDSEIVYWNSFGNEIYSSTPHSSSGHKVRAGLISQADSLLDSERNVVFNLMGDEFIEIHCTNGIPLKKGHTLLIGSDGLFDNVSHEKLSEVVAKGSFDKSFEEMVTLCKDRTGVQWIKDDDLSFILLRKMRV